MSDDRTDTPPHAGFGFAPSKIAPVRWWCWEHYPYKRLGLVHGEAPK